MIEPDQVIRHHDDPDLFRAALGYTADVSAARLNALRRQVTSQLKPVLRERDLEEFNLDRSFEAVREMAGLIADKVL